MQYLTQIWLNVDLSLKPCFSPYNPPWRARIKFLTLALVADIFFDRLALETAFTVWS
jgi:hypothetical protein